MIRKKHRLINIKKIYAVAIAILIMVPAVACGDKGSKIVAGNNILPLPTQKVEEVTVPSNSNEVKFTGVLTYLDTTGKTMHYVDIDTGTEYEVSYTGGTDIQDKYGKILAAAGMKIGDIFDITCNKSSKAAKIYESKDTFEISGLTELKSEEKNRKITVGNQEYKYETYSTVLSNKEKITVAQIVSQDEVTIRGKGSTIYSITVDKGHGYIKFTGIDSFVDGYASIGRKQLFGITKDMLVTAQEGTYNVELQKGSVVGSKSVTVARDQQITLDYSEYTQEPVKTGAVNFMVTPENAIMTIDGVETDYSQPVSLTYGTHQINLSANHYTQYTETFTVNSEYQTKVIDMVASSTSTTTSSSKTTSTTSSSVKSTTSAVTNLTEGYTVKITEPEGASLYVDSVYVGVIPCSFDKKAGTKTITLTKSGYATVSYSISIANATGNLTYSFPDMVEKGSTSETTAAETTTAQTTTAQTTKASETTNAN